MNKIRWTDWFFIGYFFIAGGLFGAIAMDIALHIAGVIR